MARSIDTISDIESKTTTCLTTSHTNEILLLYDRTIFSIARSTLQKRFKESTRRTLGDGWLCVLCGFVCAIVCDCVPIECVRVCMYVCICISVFQCVCV
jgi:hypothetical protein